MALSLLYTGLFALCGLCIATLLFASERLIKRIWYGLVLGLLLLTWLPRRADRRGGDRAFAWPALSDSVFAKRRQEHFCRISKVRSRLPVGRRSDILARRGIVFDAHSKAA